MSRSDVVWDGDYAAYLVADGNPEAAMGKVIDAITELVNEDGAQNGINAATRGLIEKLIVDVERLESRIERLDGRLGLAMHMAEGALGRADLLEAKARRHTEGVADLSRAVVGLQERVNRAEAELASLRGDG